MNEIQQQIQIHSCKTPAGSDYRQRVLVVGDGKLGQLVAQTLALTGCDLLAIGRHKEKLANLETRGIKVGFVDDVKERSFDIAVECTGNATGFDIARSALR